MLVPRKSYLSREKTLSFLRESKETGEVKKSLYVPPGLSEQQMAVLLDKTGIENTPEMARMAASSKTGAAIFIIQSGVQLLIPPFDITGQCVYPGLVIEPLVSLLSHDYRIALILVRLGSFAIGLSQGEKLIASKVGTGNIHSRHRQGGSSAARFRRHREKQIEGFLIRVCDHVEGILRPEAKSVDYVVYGGARTTILLLQKRCPFLEQFSNHTLPPLLDIAEPRQVVLESAVNRIWSSTLVEWQDDAVLPSVFQSGVEHAEG